MREQKITVDEFKSLSLRLKGISLFCVLQVVLLHSYNQSFKDPLSFADFPVAWTLETFLSREFASTAVPMFFMISGLLLAWYFKNPLKIWYINILKKRSRSLLIPYFLWCFLAAITYLPFTIYGNKLAGRYLLHNTCLSDASWSIKNAFCIFGGDFFEFPANGPLWYVRNLLLLIIISPLFILLLKKRSIAWSSLGFFGIFSFYQGFINPPWGKFFETGFSCSGLFFFYLGMVYVMQPIRLCRGLIWRWGIVGFWLGLSAYGTWQFTQNVSLFEYVWVQKMIEISGVASIWFLFDMIPISEKLLRTTFTQDAFFIFACHYLLMNILFCSKSMKIQKQILGKHSELIIYFLHFGVTVILCVVISRILRHRLPRVYGFLSGGR